jgi:carboxylesterase type B
VRKNVVKQLKTSLRNMSVIRTWIYLVLHFSVLVSFCFAGQSDDQFLLASAKFRSLTSAEASNGLIAETSNGLISGKIDRSWPDVRQFLGVPYAHPPTDEFRWQDPVRPKSWKPFIRRATSKAPSCPQLLLLEAQSEDCLYLDVFTPTTPRIDENKPLPVLVWLHGGAWIIGSGSTVGVQNPSYIVQHKNVIVVRVQYRLGPLGFLATEDLEGNYGLKDQEFALKWTKENIRKFGGDPNQVTLWGQSAGAMSISFHLTADLSHGLFQQAILESNVLGINYRTRSEATILGEALAKKVGCNVRDLACLRKVPAAVISYLRPPIGMFNQKRKLGDILLVSYLIISLYIFSGLQSLMGRL